MYTVCAHSTHIVHYKHTAFFCSYENQTLNKAGKVSFTSSLFSFIRFSLSQSLHINYLRSDEPVAILLFGMQQRKNWTPLFYTDEKVLYAYTIPVRCILRFIHYTKQKKPMPFTVNAVMTKLWIVWMERKKKNVATTNKFEK